MFRGPQCFKKHWFVELWGGAREPNLAHSLQRVGSSTWHADLQAYTAWTSTERGTRKHILIYLKLQRTRFMVWESYLHMLLTYMRSSARGKTSSDRQTVKIMVCARLSQNTAKMRLTWTAHNVKCVTAKSTPIGGHRTPKSAIALVAIPVAPHFLKDDHYAEVIRKLRTARLV